LSDRSVGVVGGRTLWKNFVSALRENDSQSASEIEEASVVEKSHDYNKKR